MMLRQLLPAELAARLTDPAAIERHNIELALRLSAAASSMSESVSPPKQTTSGKTVHAVGHPQIYVKQGASKCRECNIVFCKHENYIAHKKHYCSARITDDQEAELSKESSPPASPKVGSTSSVGGNSAKPAPTLAYQQLICAACGIKFTSLDNLSAHQMYYCPKRVDQNPAPIAAIKDKCLKCKTIHESTKPCTGPSTASFPSQNSTAYKCPMCEVVSLNAADSRRHLETHSSIKAFRCSICRYRGNTLRGMRTHIRMHFEKKSVDVNEEHYISCILEDDGIEGPPPVKTVTSSVIQPAPVQPVSVISKAASYR